MNIKNLSILVIFLALISCSKEKECLTCLEQKACMTCIKGNTDFSILANTSWIASKSSTMPKMERNSQFLPFLKFNNENTFSVITPCNPVFGKINHEAITKFYSVGTTYHLCSQEKMDIERYFTANFPKVNSFHLRDKELTFYMGNKVFGIFLKAD